MNSLVKELREIMDEKKISMETTSRYFNCSAKTIFRWLKNKNDPSLAYQRIVREEIDKIKNE